MCGCVNINERVEPSKNIQSQVQKFFFHSHICSSCLLSVGSRLKQFWYFSNTFLRSCKCLGKCGLKIIGQTRKAEPTSRKMFLIHTKIIFSQQSSGSRPFTWLCLCRKKPVQAGVINPCLSQHKTILFKFQFENNLRRYVLSPLSSQPQAGNDIKHGNKFNFVYCNKNSLKIHELHFDKR